jgi:hypothetical protein
MNGVLCFVEFACIHEFLNGADAWIIRHIVCCSFMGMLPLGFMLYSWGIFNLILAH